MSFLLIVSGQPAAGKTTMSERLGRDLGLPVVHRDRLRRYVFGEINAIAEARDLLPTAGDRLVLGVLSLIHDAGGGVILDGNFNTERHMAPVRDYVAARDLTVAEVCLWGDPAVLRERFIERADPPLTSDLEPYFNQVVQRPREPVLTPTDVIEQLDTTDLGVVDQRYDRILTRMRTVADRAREQAHR